MAKIVLGLGSSHGMLGTPADQWHKLGEKDMDDPRFSYEELLKRVKPGLEREINLETFREKAAAVERGISSVRNLLAEVNPDVCVMVSNPHGSVPDDLQYPLFGMYLSGSDSRLPRTGHQTGGRRGPGRAARDVGGVEDFASNSGLADHLLSSLIEDGFDVSCSFQSRTGAGIDGAFTSLSKAFWPGEPTPMVPFAISRYLPNQPTPARTYAFGQALRQAVESWKSDARVAIVASGGLSHQVMDEELDREVVAALKTQDAEVLCSLPRDRLNGAPGTAEILNWIAVAAAMDMPMTLIDYVPCYRSVAGTGVGVAMGYWR